LVGHHYWTVEADKATSDFEYLPTVRGRILDVKGRELAIDQPCIDASVDYRAISLQGPDPEWLRELARQLVDTHAMGRRAIGASFSEKTAAQQEEFLRLFDELIVRAYFSCPEKPRPRM